MPMAVSPKVISRRSNFDTLRVEHFRRPYARKSSVHFHCGRICGVGSRKIVVDWNALHFGLIANKGESITLELTKDQVTAATEYKKDQPIVVLGASGIRKPLQFDH
jgi:hypothetical protein